MEILSIPQNFVPCRGRCPTILCDFTISKRQGKGTADLMMPFGVLFIMIAGKIAGKKSAYQFLGHVEKFVFLAFFA